MALKEWAAVCEALAAGRQTILLRKGGIAEHSGVFRPEHDTFWLLPTYFHERPEALKPADQHFFDDAAGPTENRIRLSLFARVVEVVHLDHEEWLERLGDEHVYGPRVVHERFHYRRPGLWMLVVEVFRAAAVTELDAWPELAGCHSWVELPQGLSTDGARAAIAPAQFSARLASLKACLADESAAVKVLDIPSVLERFGGDRALVNRLVEIYRQDRAAAMSRALGALAGADKPALIFAAHRLHGLLSHFEPSTASAAAARLEQVAREGDFAAAQTTFGQLEREMDALDAVLLSWQAQL
jgi:HPt (histidine-containing phosphotransfer) domain-containing protein